MSTQELKKQIKKSADPAASPYKTVSDYLIVMKPEIEKALPKHLSPDRLTRIVMTMIRLNPGLLECTIESLLGAVMQAAQLGLQPGVLGQCYFVPFKSKKAKSEVKNVQFIIGYQGLIELSRRTGDVSQITVQAVHENDLFSYEYGSNQHLKHVPYLGHRGETIAYYCFTKLKSGEESFTVMSKPVVEAHRDRFSKFGEFGPWKDDFDAMAKKTVLRQHFKYMPMSIDFAESLERDETVRQDYRSEEAKPFIELMTPQIEEKTVEVDAREVADDAPSLEGAIQKMFEKKFPDLKNIQTAKSLVSEVIKTRSTETLDFFRAEQSESYEKPALRERLEKLEEELNILINNN